MDSRLSAANDLKLALQLSRLDEWTADVRQKCETVHTSTDSEGLWSNSPVVQWSCFSASSPKNFTCMTAIVPPRVLSANMANASCRKANCLLLAVRGNYYYTEELGRFIQIREWEYDRILNFPYRAYFTTALKKHREWHDAKRKGTTLTVAEALV